MPTLSMTAKIGLGVGVAVAAVGAYVLYKKAAATAEEEEDDEATSSEEEEDSETPADAAKTATATSSSAADAGAADKSGAAGAAATTASGSGDASDAQFDETTVKPVSREKMVQLLNNIFQHTSSLAQRLFAQQNGENPLPPAELKQHFHMNSEMIHRNVLRRLGVNHPSFMAAMNEYKSDGTVRQLMGQTYRLSQIIEHMATELPDVPEDMTVDKFLPILQQFMDALVEGTKAGVEEGKSSGLSGEKLAEATMAAVSKKVPEAQDAVLEKLGMSKELLQACLKKYMRDPRVTSAVQEAQQTAMQLAREATPEIGEQQLM